MFRGRLLEEAAGGGIACGVARFQQCLELPGTSPPVPVRDVGIDGPDEHAGAALGAEVGIDAVRVRGDSDERARERGIDSGRIGRDEDEIDVARVVELLRPVLAHGDDGEAVGGPREADGAGQHSVRDQRESAGHLLEVVQADEITRGDLEKRQMLATYEVVDVVCFSRVPAHLTGNCDRAGRGHVQLREHVQGCRVGDDHARQRVAGSHDRCEAGGEGGLGLQPFAGCRERGEELIGHQPHRVGSRRRADKLVEQLWRWHR